MGLESLSRGAAHVTLFEMDRSALDRLKKNIAMLDVAERCEVVSADLFRWFQAAEGRASPPCRRDLSGPPLPVSDRAGRSVAGAGGADGRASSGSHGHGGFPARCPRFAGASGIGTVRFAAVWANDAGIPAATTGATAGRQPRMNAEGGMPIHKYKYFVPTDAARVSKLQLFAPSGGRRRDHRPAQVPASRLQRRILRASGVCARRRAAASGLARLCPVRPLLHQAL